MMNSGVTQPEIISRARDESFHANRLKEAAPEMLVLLLRISESTSHLPQLYEAADDATTFIDQLISGTTESQEYETN